jgi:hypothetical protein
MKKTNGRLTMWRRPICEALSHAMRGALLTGCSYSTSTARSLAARRLVSPGPVRFRLPMTPLGRQVGKMLHDLHVMRVALVDIEHQAEPGTPLHGLALRALARSRRWT